MNKKNLAIFGLLALGVIGLVGILSKVSLGAVFDAFSHARLSSVLLFLFCSFMVMSLFTLRWQMILKTQGHVVPLWKLFIYRVCGYGVGAVTPTAKTGGEPVRVMLLKRHKLPMKDRVFSVLTDKILETSTNFVFFVAGLVLIMMKFAMPANVEFLLILAILVCAGIIGLFFYRMLRGKHFFHKTFKLMKLSRFRSLKGVEKSILEMEKIMIGFFGDHKKEFFVSVFLSFLGWVFTFGELKYALQIVGVYNVNVAQIFIILSFLGLAFLLPIPLAIGSLEALQISTFQIMRFESAPAAVAMSFIIRARDLLWTAIAIVALSYYGMNFSSILKKSLRRVDEEVTSITLSDGRTISVKKSKK